MRLRPGLFLLLVGLVLLPGCGSAGMAPVKGRVTCNGEPVKEAHVIFAPEARFEGDKEPGRSATGFTDADGNFALSTHSSYDGALIGKHNVKVTLDDTNPARCKRVKELVLEVKPGSNQLNIELDPK